MQDEKERGKLSWFKWTVEDANVLRETLTETQVGIFFLAVMRVVETGELDINSVPPEMQIVYRLFCQKVLAAITAYANKCAVNASNGAKGGKAKANSVQKKNAEDRPTPAFKPPTKTEFKNMSKHIRMEYELNLDAYEIDRIYDDLVSSGWTYHSVPLTTREQIEAIIYAKALHDINYLTAVHLFLEKGYVDLEADTIDYLLSSYDEGREEWQLVKPKGPWYSTIKDAVNAYLTDD